MFGSRSARSSPKCAGFGGKRSRGMAAQTSPVEGRYSSSQTKAPSDGRSSSAFRGAHSPAPSRERSGYVASKRISRVSLRFVSGADRCQPAGADPETPSMGSANPAGPSAERAPSSAPQPRQGAARAMTATMSHRRIPTDVRSGRGPGSVSRLRRAVRRPRSVRDADVNDAFGSAHRAHASTEAVARLLPAYAGLLLERELEELGRLLGDVERPFVLVSGGAKVEDKLGVLRNLGGRADDVLVGGKMAEELRDDSPLPFEVVLPDDVVAASEFAEHAETKIVSYDELPAGWLGLDIGPATRERFSERLARARTIFWNGPMGVFEWPRFAEGTKAVAEAVARADAHTVVGGADSIRALTELGLVDEVDWASTGGGAALELLEGKELPGVVAIPEAT